LLRALGTAAFACGLLAFCLVVPALVGLPLGIAVAVMARRDLARMDAGVIDPAGRQTTGGARELAAAGAMLSVPGLFWLLIALMVVSH
jgi:hypothetical protein